MSHDPRHCARLRFFLKYTRAICGQRWPSVAFNSAGYNYNRSVRMVLRKERWESPRKQWPCSSTREMAKLLPSAGIVEKVFNYLIDRVTGARTQPLPRHPARCSIAKTYMRVVRCVERKDEGGATLGALGAADLKVWSRRHGILHNSIDF